jgi:hypothetical protein
MSMSTFVSTVCRCHLPMSHVLVRAACPCPCCIPMSVLHVHVSMLCRYSISMLHVHAERPCCMYVHSSFPRCMSARQCSCCKPISMLHVHVRFACSCQCCMCHVSMPAREKAPWVNKKKGLLTLTPGDDAEGRNEVGDDDDDGCEPVKPITSPCDNVSGY